MDSAAGWSRYTIVMFHFLTVLSSKASSGYTVDVSSEKQLPSGADTSVDAAPERSTLSLRSQNRWQPQMAFSKTVYSFEVTEDTVAGTVVGKVETMFASLTPPTYSVEEDDGESLFLLSPLSGEFLLSRSLDFETQRFFIVTVALLLQEGLQVSSVRVYFNVLDVNDNPPVFSRGSFSVSLLEDTRAGTCFLFLNVSDEDDGDNGDVKLSVVQGDDANVFFINPAGRLCLHTALDRERRPSYNLTVTAADGARPSSLQLTSTARVHVVVEDVNDNAPRFVSAQSVGVPEDAALHSVVTTVHAEDADSGSNREVLYHLNDTCGGTFSIDTTTGQIHLEEALDREHLDRLTVTVTATDNGSPRMSTTMEITLEVEDANDHDPEFSQDAYNLTVREDVPRGTSLGRVQAHDQDVGKNGRVRYLLTQTSPFVVDAVRGVITVMEKLDREKESSYSFIITAVDQGDVSRSASAALTITVLDVNDFTPLFYPQTLIIHVMEEEAELSELTHQVAASDEDVGVNSQLTYFLQTGSSSGSFSVTPSGTLEISQQLDREKESLHTVTVTAVDSGTPALTGTLTVHVVVEDVNDNRPQFTEDVYNTLVPEDSPAGTVFALITASDIDDGASGEVSYFMGNLDVPFSIDETTGELFTTDLLDRETVAIYSLTVMGRDQHPTRPLSSSVRVTVSVRDANDHWPQFLNSPYVAYVPTEMAPGSVVCAVRATDGDTDLNAELRYSLYGPSSDLFSISPQGGAVFTSGALRGREDIIVNVHAEDAGENPKFDISTISIRFQNASDFPEMKVEVLRGSLSEDEPRGTLVAVVSAASARAQPVSFYLASGNSEDIFHVEPSSGNLTVEKRLDYESRQEFTLLIEARDSGSPPFSSFVELHINISDVNDNVPKFPRDEYRCEVFENSPPSRVCDVLATDADSGRYGAVRYNITEGNTDGSFTIDLEGGALSTTLSLDREHVAEFNLTVEAAESDDPRRRDTATVIVVVLDRNDNAPRFPQIFLTEVPEDSPVGHTIMQVTSADDDAGANAVSHYSIINRKDDTPFDIDDIGFITVERRLDREVQDHYVLKVNANDSAWSVSTDVTVVITDVNDNRPVFSHRLYTTVIPETRDEDVFVMRVSATDADAEQNAEILYVIDASNEEFWVNATSGDIYTKQALTLHKSAFEISQFTVTAFDCGSDPLHSNSTVTVRLEPYNYHPPMFLPLQPQIPVPYHMPLNTEVVQITATDPDVRNSSSASIEYVSIGGNASDFFMIQADSGKVRLTQSLTESVSSFLTLIVMAKDQGSPSRSSQTEVTFEVTGKNQFSPSFREADVTLSVPEDLPVASVIRRVQAEDGDDGPNGAVMYGIIPEDQHIPFSVGEASGLLTLITDLDFEKQHIYRFQIRAVDGAWLSKSGVLNVTVIVVDVNDNPPVFSASEYIASVPENSAVGTNVLNVEADDADSGANAQITFSLVTGHVDKFTVDSRNGAITTLDVFDYEREQVFYITVKAVNTGGRPLFTLAHVVIRISDVNEFTPEFVQKLFNFSVIKNAPVGTRIGKVRATDYDGGSAGRVFYRMFGVNKQTGFDVDTLTGDLYTTVSLRRQGNSHMLLKVLAKNSGVITGSDVDEALVQVSVMDANDAPVFTSASYTASVAEDIPVGTSVITVSAQDQDSVLDWDRFLFDITHGNTNSSFTIDPSTGVMTLSAPLDRERWPVYNLTVTASDHGSPPATGAATVIVTVRDVNDNTPKLTFTEARVKENQPEGTVVAELNASDSDSPPNRGPFTYWLVEASPAFSLTPDGVLFTTRPTDRERIPAYRVLVAVRDAGIPSLSSTTTFHIGIVDENDNPSTPRNIFIEVKYFGSSFEGGVIGNVHPDDPDEADAFDCVIRSGLNSMFMIPNGTCELWSSPFQGEATFNITIEATDRLHLPVNNSIYINYKGFTNATMDSSVLFYVTSPSMEEFLSQKYLRFVKALDSLFNLQASKTHVFGIKQVGNQILLLAAVKNYNGQYLSREVASGISAGHRRLLESQSNVTISHITSDPCLDSSCQNGATCLKNIHISPDVAVLESTAVIFVSPRKEILNCTCPTGFAGSLCEEDVDECGTSPCETEATCVNTPGSFYCRCQTGVSGSVCSSDVDECLKLPCQSGGTCIPTAGGHRCRCDSGFEGENCEQLIDHCRSTPCVQGSCVPSQRGFSCLCPFGVGGLYCEQPGYGFDELSFMEFPPLHRRTNLISLELATVQKSSLLLYNPGGPSSGDFLALEIINGSVCLSYDLGSGPVRLRTHKQVADGHFHSVTARRIGSMGSLLVDDCGDTESNGFCFSHSDGRNSERTLDVSSSNVTIGGLRTVESVSLRPAQIQTHDFVGCVRNVHVNGLLLGPSTALAAHNILDRCPRAAASPCHRNPCQNGGECRDVWTGYLCSCRRPFAGINCDEEISEEFVLRLNGRDHVEYVVKERYKRDRLLQADLEDRTDIHVRFKTKDNGVILFVLAQTGFIILQIRDSKPVYVSRDVLSGNLSEFVVDSSVADGFWHVLSLFSEGHKAVLLLDGKLALNITDGSIDVTPVHVEKIILGSAQTGDSKLDESGFNGCVQYFNVTGHQLPVSGHSEMMDVWPSPTLLQPSCSPADYCSPSPCTEEDTARTTCLLAHCQNRWRCGPATLNGSCICLRNVSARDCDICITVSESYDDCPETGSRQLWFLAVILPVLSILAIIGMFAALYRSRQQNQMNNSPQKTDKGTENAAFCFDDGRNDAVSAGQCKQPDRGTPDQQRSSVEFYWDGSLSGVQPVSNSELEYYEINSLCSAFRADSASLELSWHKHLYSTKCVNADPERWGDLKMLLAGFKKRCIGEESERGPAKPRNVASSMTKIDSEASQETQRCYTRRVLQPELDTGPIQSLTFEEINKLNSPLEETASHGAALTPEPANSTPMIRVSSDCEADSSDSDAAGHSEAANTPSGMLEHWESILNISLPVGAYAPVFEDIARLSVKPVHSRRLHADTEAII